MACGHDIGEVFRKAWTANCRREYGYLGSKMIPGMEIRRFASAFAGSCAWKCVDAGATDDQLYLLGLDIARFRCRGCASNDLFSLGMGRFDRTDLVELGRIAHNAVHGPAHPVIKALFRRYKE